MTDGHVPASGSMPQQSPSLVGQVLDGRYRLTRKLGEGGMGEVYAAEHVHIEKKLAIKLLRPEIVSNPEAVNRFRQEARSSSSIGHRNIIAIEDFGQLSDGRIYMCMELLNGAALNDLITTPQPVDRLLNILIQTGHGLAAAHAKNIIHRDMKPENIFVTTNGQEDVPKLLDFGIAKVAGNDGQNNLTRTGTIFGTPFYMAPEQALGNAVDARTDIYAMGVIMYEVFAGSLPFQGESFMGILTQHITTEPEPVAHRAAKAGRVLPPGLTEVITRCMQKNPAARFQTMDELVGTLVPIYRSIAGPGMSTYMEAFPVNPTSARMAVPTPGPMTGPMTGPRPMTTPPGVAPTVGVHTGGMHPMGGAISGPSGVVSPSGSQPNYMPGYHPGDSTIAPKKSRVGLIVVLTLLLAAGGGLTAFLVTREGGGTSNGSSGSGSQVANNGSDDINNGSNKTGSNTNGSNTGANGSNGPGSDGPHNGSNHATVDAAVVVEPADAAVAVEVDAAVAGAKKISVLITVRNLGAFQIFDGDSFIADGPANIDVEEGSPRTLTLKAHGYRDKKVTVTGTKPKEQFKLELAPVVPQKCTATSCKPDEACGADGKCRKKEPQGPDCTNTIVNSKDKACIRQYCAGHKGDPVCDLQ